MDAKALEYPWLNPDNLCDFLDELREVGFAVAVPDYIKVHQLVIRLLANGVELKQPAQFGRYLGPLLCSSKIEQLEFQQRFANWIGRLNVTTRQNQAEEARQEERERIRKRRRIVRLLVISTVLLIFAALIFFTSQNIIHVPEVIIPDILPEERASYRPEVNFAKIRIMGLITVLSLLLLGLFRVIFVRWRTRQYLERHSTKEKPQLDTISIVYNTEALFPPIAFFRLAERMRRRVRVTSPELDINATLQHTLSQGGWLMPVREMRLQVPEYLVLIDRSTFRDHQTRLIEEMVAQLTEQGVLASIFFFDRDPRVCYPADAKKCGVTLQALSKSHANHRLLLFADAEHLFHPLRNELAVWTDFFFAWSEGVLLTTKSREHWGHYETEAQSAMAVLPATANALTTFLMSDLLASRQADSEQTRPPLPRLIIERPYPWLSRDKPDEALIRKVLLGLRTYLDRAGFFWLCACAIFPKLQWNITLYLGQQLKTDEGHPLLSYDRLVALVRLPWFRHGYMPDWFRLYLISTLTPTQEQDVRQTLQALLLNAVSEANGPHQLEITRPFDFWSRSILRLLARNASEDSPFQDVIFRTYAVNNGRLSVRMPIELQDRLLSGDRRRLDWAIWREWTITHALGGTVIWLIGFFSLELGSFLIDEYGPSPLRLLVISLVVFSFALLQVWAGRKRIEPDWYTFCSLLGGMAFTHIPILPFLSPVSWPDEWSFWAIFGAGIGLSDSLGRHLFSSKRDANDPAHIRSHESIAGFAVGFAFFGWWLDIFYDPLNDFWVIGLFFIWLSYGMVTGVALVWGNLKAIPIPYIWHRIKLPYVDNFYDTLSKKNLMIYMVLMLNLLFFVVIPLISINFKIIMSNYTLFFYLILIIFLNKKYSNK